MHVFVEGEKYGARVVTYGSHIKRRRVSLEKKTN